MDIYELLKQDKFEKGINDIIRFISGENGSVDGLLKPEFISCSEIDRTITIVFPVLEWELNANKVMHGGIIAMIFDEVLGIFANYISDKRAVTSNITVNYLRPVPMNEDFIITAKLTSAGRKLITLTGEGRLKSNNMLTDTAMATYTII